MQQKSAAGMQSIIRGHSHNDSGRMMTDSISMSPSSPEEDALSYLLQSKRDIIDFFKDIAESRQTEKLVALQEAMENLAVIARKMLVCEYAYPEEADEKIILDEYRKVMPSNIVELFDRLNQANELHLKKLKASTDKTLGEKRGEAIHALTNELPALIRFLRLNIRRLNP